VSENLLKKYTVKYFQCSLCGYAQTEEPYWLKEAYDSPINDSYTGMMMGNLWHGNMTTTLIFNKKGLFLDYDGGYRVFVRLVGDIGFDNNCRINTGKICLLKVLKILKLKIDKLSC